MKNIDLINEISERLNIDKSELSIEQKGKSLLVRRYNDEVCGLIIAKYNARKDAIEIIG